MRYSRARPRRGLRSGGARSLRVMPRTATSLRVAAAAVIAACALGAAPAAASAETPPQLYVNGALKPLVSTCIEESAPCGATEKHTVRSAYEPFVAWGSIAFNMENSALGPVRCSETMSGYLFNQREGDLTDRPARGYGAIQEWSASACVLPPLLGYGYEYACSCRPTAFLTAETPLEYRPREAIICSRAAYIEGKTTLSECPSETEREVETLYAAPHPAARGTTSLPWNVEFSRGDTAAHEQVVRQIIGEKSLGACNTELSGEVCAANEERGSCYPTGPAGPNGEPHYSYTEIPRGCMVIEFVVPQIPVEIPFFGSQELTLRNGAGSGVDPSRIEYEEAHTGVLRSQEDEEGGGWFSGTVKELGSEGQALLAAK